MIFELRMYHTKPGKREEWVKFFEEEFLPYQFARGVVIVGSFVSEEDEDEFIWIRRYDSEEDRERLDAAFYGSDRFKNDLAPRADELLDYERMQVLRLRPTPKSVIH